MGIMRIEAGAYFVFDASSGVCGPDNSVAITEGGPNALTKLVGEHLCRLYAQLHGLRFVALRLFSVWGPGSSPEIGLLSKPLHRFSSYRRRGYLAWFFARATRHRSDNSQTINPVPPVPNLKMPVATNPHDLRPGQKPRLLT
jgi:nucleoside-diphosphate-sugar epimerase